MKETDAKHAAGRMLIRYGWPLDQETLDRLPGTDREGARARAQNDPRATAAALEACPAGAELVELVKQRRHTEASAYARQLALTPPEPRAARARKDH